MARKGTRLLLWVTIIGLLILVAGVTAGVLLMQQEESVGDGDRWMYVKLAGLSDAPGAPGLFDDPGDMPPLSTELTRLIRDAAVDDQIPGLLLEVGPLGAGWAQAQEIRDALEVFADTGKPCIAWAETWTNKEYYVATACGEVQMPPHGTTLVNGLSVTQTYYAGTFEKLDIRANFEHVGDFKSAVEPYERTGPSEAAQAATDLLLDGLYSQLISGIAEGRGMDMVTARALVDIPPMAPADALARGLVDDLTYRDQAKDLVELHGGVAPAEDAAAVPEESRKELRHYRDYLQDRRKAWKKKHETRVAVIYAEGAIVSGTSTENLFGGQVIGDKTVRRQVREAREDDTVDIVVLRVNSPGGSGSASDAILREVVLTQEVKPVIVSMGDYAASGGYYIAMSADRIFAEPGTITGSIGVFGGKINMSGAMAKLGLSQHSTKRGKASTLLSGMHDFDEQERAIFRSYLEGFYDTFVSKAAEGRDMSWEELHAVAQGRVWTGDQALERGLVDELGSLDDAIAYAVEQVAPGTPIDQVSIQRIPERKTFFEQIMEDLEKPDRQVTARVPQLTETEAAALAIVSVAPEAQEALSGALNLRQILAGGDVAAMLPGHIAVQ